MMPLFDNESVKPFKLKENLVGDSDKILFIAEKYFGKPSSKNCRWDDPVRGPCLSADWRGDWWLSISHFLGEETIKIEFRWGNRLLEYEHEQIKIQSFINDVKKPWSEWTEDEILSSPEWIVAFAEENGHSSQKMHTKMVMISYQDPENGLVQKYFKNIPFTTLGDESFQAWFGVQKK